MRDLLIFTGANNPSEAERATLVISCTEKQGLVWSRIDVFFQIINYLIILGTLDIRMGPGVGERLTIRISCK